MRKGTDGMKQTFKKYRVTASAGTVIPAGHIIRGLSDDLQRRFASRLVQEGKAKGTFVTTDQIVLIKGAEFETCTMLPRIAVAVVEEEKPATKAKAKAPAKVKPKGKAADPGTDPVGDDDPSGSDGGVDPAAGDGTDTVPAA